MSKGISIVCWTVLGDGWSIPHVKKVLGVKLPRPSFTTRVARELRKRKVGTIVYAQRGTKPHMAVVRSLVDPAHTRPGALETLDWLIVDPRECSVRISRRLDPKLLEAVRAARDDANCYSASEVGKLIAQWVRDSLDGIPLRKGAGGVYIIPADRVQRVAALERMLAHDTHRVVFFTSSASLASAETRETLLRALLLYSENVYKAVVRYASSCTAAGTRGRVYTERLEDSCARALRVTTLITADVPSLEGEALSKVYSRIHNALRCVAQLKRTVKVRRRGRSRAR